MQENTKVVPIDTKQPGRNESPTISRNPPVNECRTIFVERFERLLAHFFEKIDDELFALSDKAENSTLQTQYFDAMRYVRKEREVINKNYFSHVISEYDNFWKGRQIEQLAKERKHLDEDSFELLENEVLEEDLAITTMVEKGNNRFHRSLFDLNLRFAYLIGKREIDNEDNPLAPFNICHGFEKTTQPLELDFKVKLVIYKLFDAMVLSHVGNIYNELNSILVNHGVLPVISRRVNQKDSMASSVGPGGNIGAMAENPLASAHLPSPYQDDQISMEAFHAIQSLLSDWRSRLGINSTANVGANIDGALPSYQTNEVMHALSQIQHANAPINSTGFTNDQGIKMVVANELKKQFSDGKARPLAELEEDIIDMVAMIFDFILDDKNLPDAVKALIGRLQIPIVKIAILEKSFFSRKNHPGRQLLNALAKAGVGLDNEACETSPIFAEIGRIVNRILSDFDQDVNLLNDLLEEFKVFTGKDDQRANIMEKRTQQVTQSKEQLMLAKQTVTDEITQCLHGKPLQGAIRNFIENVWKDVLVLSYLRKDKEPKNWETGLLVTNRLVWTTVPPADIIEKKKKLQVIPRLLKDIRIGLEAISYDPHEMAKIFRDLEECHVSSLNKTGQIAQSSETTTTNHQAGHIKNPGLDKQLDRISENLPDIDEQPTTNVIEAPTELADEYSDLAASMKVGQWLELVDQDNKAVRVKLSWKSDVTSLYVFVNRKGVKVNEKSVNEVAADLRQGKMELIENTDKPLMDRALLALIENLKTSSEVEAVPA